MLAAQLGCLLLAGAQGLFTLPQRYGKHLAALTVDEEIDPLKAFHLLEAGHDVLLSVAQAIVYLVRRTLVGGYTRKHVTSFIPRVPYQSGCAQGIKAGGLTLLPRIPLLGTWVHRVLQRCPTCYRCMMHPLHVAVRHLRCLAYLRRRRRHTCRTFLSGAPNSRTFLSGSTSRLRRRLAIRTRSTSFS